MAYRLTFQSPGFSACAGAAVSFFCLHASAPASAHGIDLGDRNAFPFVQQDVDDPLPRFAQFRAEGKSLRSNLLGTRSYITKWFRKHPWESLDGKVHFDEERALFRRLDTSPLAPPPTPRVRLGLVGDIMWLQDGWSSYMRPETRARLERFDGLIGNLETPVSRSVPVAERLPEYARYNSHPDLVRSFRRTDGRGKNLLLAVSTANNHTMDAGDVGASETLSFLDAEGIRHSGVREQADAPKHVILDVGGIKIGFYATTWGFNSPADERNTRLSVNILSGLARDDAEAVSLTPVAEALRAMEKDGAELKIVSIHWGFEYEMYPTQAQMILARRMASLGADVVMGHHPHVPQPAEACFFNGAEEDLPWAASRDPQAEVGCRIRDGSGVRRKALILYSLGNFVSKMFTSFNEIGLLQELTLFRRPDGRVDWEMPKTELFYNLRRHPVSDKREFWPLDAYLDAHCFGHACHPDFLTAAAFFERHLRGESLGPDEEEDFLSLGWSEFRRLLPLGKGRNSVGSLLSLRDAAFLRP